MYLRHTTLRKNGKVHRYWRLVRGVRVGRRVIQQTVAHLGELDERGRIEARALAQHLIGAPERAQLFNDGSEHLTVPVRLKGIQSHDVVLPTATHGQIRLRCVTQPDPAQAALLDRLGIILPKPMRLAEHELPAFARSA